MQVGCIAVGLTYSLRTLHYAWQERVDDKWGALLGGLPMSAFLCAVAIGMVCFYAG
jgi:hypothetical protein